MLITNIFRILFFILLALHMAISSYAEETRAPQGSVNAEQTGYYNGLAYAIRGKFQNAKREFEIAESDPRFASAAANCLAVIESMEEKKIKNDTAVHFFRGTDFLNKNRIDDAITEFSLAIFINLKCADAYNSRGYAYAIKKEYDNALKDYSRAIDFQPDNVSVYNNRGNIYCEKGEFDLALADYTKAIRLDPENADAYNNRGFVYIIKLHEREAGCKDLEKACSLGGCRNYKLAIQKGLCEGPEGMILNE
jgi:Flp pilus assembly protein TadD